MPYEMKITASDPADFAQKLAGLALLFGGKAPAPAQPFVPTGDAQSEQAAPIADQAAGEAPKRRGRPAKSEPVAEKPAEQPADEKPADAAPEPAADAKPMTYDELRVYVIDNYLNACFPQMEDRRKAFASLLGEFDATKLVDIPADKHGALKARVDALIAEKKGGAK